jgi:hypothetical protein
VAGSWSPMRGFFASADTTATTYFTRSGQQILKVGVIGPSS